MSTPVPATFKLTWSHSSLNTFETCPLKYYHEKINKTAIDLPNEAAAWGTQAHQALEDFAKQGTALPSNMEQYAPLAATVSKLRDVSTASFFEHKMAVTRQGVASEYHAPEACGRAISDVLLITKPTEAIIIDYKFGKYRGKSAQPLINAWMAFKHFPEINTVNTRFVYVKENYQDKDTYTRDTIDYSFGTVESMIQSLEYAVQHQSFPARKNGLCRQYCGVLECFHNGRRNLPRVQIL